MNGRQIMVVVVAIAAVGQLMRVPWGTLLGGYWWVLLIMVVGVAIVFATIAYIIRRISGEFGGVEITLTTIAALIVVSLSTTLIIVFL